MTGSMEQDSLRDRADRACATIADVALFVTCVMTCTRISYNTLENINFFTFSKPNGVTLALHITVCLMTECSLIWPVHLPNYPLANCYLVSTSA